VWVKSLRRLAGTACQVIRKKSQVLDIFLKAEIIVTAPAFPRSAQVPPLVPADAFYEWEKIDAEAKQPARYRHEGRLSLRLR
jgi:putative SOS response-associated peptidase YedK